MDVIFGELQDPSLIASIINDDDDDDYGIDVEMKDVLESDQPSYPIKNHDCMWSGTCDISHTSKKKGKQVSIDAILKEYEQNSDSDSGKSLTISLNHTILNLKHFKTTIFQATWHQIHQNSWTQNIQETSHSILA